MASQHETKDLIITVEFRAKNFASDGDIESMGGMVEAIKTMITSDGLGGLFGCVDDDYSVVSARLED